MDKKYLYIILAVAVVALIALVFFWQSKQSLLQKDYVSTDVAGLSEAGLAQTVELKNGDVYNLTASYVKKNINGTEYRMLAYNGSIPGPILKIPQ